MNNIKKANNIEPLKRVSGILIKPNAAIVSNMRRGNVVLIIKSSTEMGFIIARIPITRNIFAIFDPMTLPTAISL